MKIDPMQPGNDAVRFQLASIGLAGGRMAEGPAIARGSPATLRGIFA